ncbi:MAG: OsmC family peroxiredoxin [Phenylobacterium sp.]|uniref:OsmC family protein n=1 Tax=Phenylobacterium sp. TaxID=1871053 RepID=UPI0025F47984|nr:OsmC family protein [Phenylobacterium sp.]MBI1197609.1 OsmC family peroxiredoxin [Phenylobacterium sp.]
MATYRATIAWTLRETPDDFLKGRYGRAHTVSFAEHVVPATASRHVVGKWAAPGAVDPEEMFVAALSNCHMLTFLHKARLAGFVVTAYRDVAEGVMEKIDGDRMAVTRVTLRPEITYEGRRPTEAERDALHHEAHEECFIANSVKTEVTVEEVVPA